MDEGRAVWAIIYLKICLKKKRKNIYIQSVLIIYSSYFPHSNHKHWFSGYWATAPRGNKRLGFQEPPVTSSSAYLSICLQSHLSTDQYVTLVYTCSLWEKLHGTHCWNMNPELVAWACGSFSNTWTFSARPIPASPCSRCSDGTLAPRVRATVSS